MIWAYILYGLGVVFGAGMFWYIVRDAWGFGDYIMAAFMGVIVGLCFALLGGIIHYSVWESAQPAYSLPKHRWACTNTRTEVVTTYTYVNNSPIPITSYQTVCTQYTER